MVPNFLPNEHLLIILLHIHPQGHCFSSSVHVVPEAEAECSFPAACRTDQVSHKARESIGTPLQEDVVAI